MSMLRQILFGGLLLVVSHATAAPPPAGLGSSPDARLTYDRNGRLRLATHLDLVLPDESPVALLDRLQERFPDVLPTPAGLTPHTRTWTLGALRVIQRSWSWNDIAVEGLSLTVHVNAHGHIIVISSPGLGLDTSRPPQFLLPERAAEKYAAQVVRGLSDFIPGDIAASRAIQATAPGPRAFWRFRIDDETPGLPLEIRIDATSGDLMALLPAAVTFEGNAYDATGEIYNESPIDGRLVDGLLTDLEGNGYLTGAYADVFQFVPPGSLSQTATPTSSDDSRFDYPPIEVYSDTGPSKETQTDTFAEVMMYHHVNTVHAFFNTLGYYNDDPREGIDRSMQATVNYRGFNGFYNNAYYSLASGNTPGQMVFGQGQATDFSYDSSVIYHEYGHALINGTSDYIFYCVNDLFGTDCTQGGLSEGTADYFSASLRGDPTVGRYSLGEWLPEYARDLRDPQKCPDDLYGEEHEDGKIWGGGLWDVRYAVAGSDSALAHVTIDPVILATAMTPIATDTAGGSAFSLASDVLLTDAEAAFGAGSSRLQAVHEALTARGLVNCERLVPLKSGVVKEGAFSTAVRPSRQSASAAGLQYVVKTSESATSLYFILTGLDHATLYFRKDEPVEFYSDGTVSLADLEWEANSFTLDADSTPVLDPGHTYYITFTSTQTLETAFYGYYYSVQATTAQPFSPGENTSGGCGCRQPAGTGLPPLPLTLLGLIPAWIILRRTRNGPFDAGANAKRKHG